MPEILEIRDRPQLRHPLVIAGFAGWGNAGSAATGAVEYLIGDDRPAPAAMADSDACLDFTVARPLTLRGGRDGWRLQLPQIACYVMPRPAANRDLVLVHGPEPNFRWSALAAALAAYFADLGAELVVMLGGYVGAVSHRTTAVSRRTLHAPLDVALAQFNVAGTDYEGPTAFQTMLLHATHDQGIPAASLWTAAPPYVQGPSPKASLALLKIVQKLADTDLDLDRLEARSTDWVHHLDGMLASNPALTAQLSRVINLEEPETVPESTSSPVEPETPGSAPNLPTGSSLVAELEEYLRKLRQNDEPSSGN